MFAIVMWLVLLICTLTILSSVLCINGRRYVCRSECYVSLTSCVVGAVNVMRCAVV